MAATILEERKNNVDKFNELYEKDRFIARIFAIENKPSNRMTVMNEESNDVFQIFESVVSYQVTTTMKRYVSSKNECKIFVNKNKFFFFVPNNMLKPLSLNMISGKVYEKIFIERFPWIRFLKEQNFTGITFNTIIRHKLYSTDKVMRHIYKCPLPSAKTIKQYFNNFEWKQYAKSCINLENVNADILQDQMFFLDCCKMAFALNEKINLAWSVKRLNQEHDAWSKKYTAILSEMNNEPMRISNVFVDLHKSIGGKIFTQSGELVKEGMAMQHCVAAYKHNVNSGRCAIFNIDGYTAEFGISNSGVYLNQFKGIRNSEPPIEIKNNVIEKVMAFNGTYDFSKTAFVNETAEILNPF